ncbi:hypothetical protein INR49_021358 [Caranx melampygus]|nr:hypothetical protein INR49_021358 [Caranx melampygus]
MRADKEVGGARLEAVGGVTTAALNSKYKNCLPIEAQRRSRNTEDEACWAKSLRLSARDTNREREREK